MTSEREIPEAVLRFIEEHIDNIPQLETLLMMSESGGRTWLISEVAARNYISIARAEETLHALSRRGLVLQEHSPPRYRYDPVPRAIGERVLEVARCYRSNLSGITSLIHSRPSAAIKEFARAFDLKKDR